MGADRARQTARRHTRRARECLTGTGPACHADQGTSQKARPQLTPMYSLYTRARDRSSAAPSGRCIFSCLRDHSQSSVSFFTSSTCIFRFRIRLRFTARAHIVIVIETPARDRPTAHAYLSQARVISGARSAEDMHRAEIHRAREILPVPFPFLSPPGWQCSTQRCAGFAGGRGTFVKCTS